jgi:hypothetical protein
LLDAEAGRWLKKLADAPLDGSPAGRLRVAAAGLERARVAAKLAVDPEPPAAPGPAEPAAVEPAAVEPGAVEPAAEEAEAVVELAAEEAEVGD